MSKLSIKFFLMSITILCIIPLYNSLAAESLNLATSKGSNGSAKLNSSLKGISNKISNMIVTRGDAESTKLSSLSNPLIKIDDNGNVQVYLYCNEVSDSNLEELLSIGLIVEEVNEDLKIIQGWLPYENLEEAAEAGFVVKVTPPSYAHTRAGSLTTQGDAVLGSDDVRNILGFDGTGVKIGVISDGVDNLAMSQATGDLPGFVDVGSNANGGDEGTAMLEIIHDIAPGADLAFYTAFPTSMNFLNAITFFMNNGVDIIVDDVGFLTQPYFQDGELAQAAQNAVDNGIIFVSAAGNDAQRHYQAFYIDDGGLDPDDDLHNFGAAAGGSSDVGMTYEIPGGGLAAFFLQWSDPFGSSSNDYDLFIVDSFSGDILDSGTNPQNGNDDPFEFAIVENDGFGSLLVEIIIRKLSGTPQTLEMNFNLDGDLTEFNVPEDAIFGHPAAPGVLATAAFDWKTPNTIESFSSHGPSSIISPSDATISTRAAITELRQKPEFSAPDGVSTTVPGFTTFFGTSAAAPHAAAVAALVLEAIEFTESNATLGDTTIAKRQVVEVKNALTSTAVDLGQPGFDNISGFGRINAFAAVQSVLAAGPTPTPTPIVPTGQPTASPTPTPTDGPTPASTGDGSSGGGCSLQGPIAGNMMNAAILNLVVLFVPALIFGAGIMIKRRSIKRICH
ncbi:MAG: S8 family serine peptidase [Candidatus Dadabacteria bacterium]